MKKFSKELYSKEVLLKAAYAFTDTLYIHLDSDEDSYSVELTGKDRQSCEDDYNDFENELIAQENRLIISEKTKNIREMIVARSLASTMINMEEQEDSNNDEFSADEILNDWFENE